MRIRTVGVVASLLVAAPVLAVGQPAVGAESGLSSTPAVAAQGNISTEPLVTAEAWQTGRVVFGAAATAAQAVASYWTPDRMRSAVAVEESPTYRAAIERYQRSRHQDGSRPRGGPSASQPGQTASQDHTVRPYQGKIDAQPKPEAHDPEFDYWQPTARTTGKVFFNLGGADYVCSATVVNSEGQNTVWTAGHCVHGGEGGTWATNWQFVPAYNDELADPRPYDTWFGGQLWTRTSWATSSDISSDLGVAIITPMKGNSIVGYLGGQGFHTSVGTAVNVDAFGYPSESPFDGGELYHCKGLTSPEWVTLFMWSETLKISCDMTRGASGGAWLHDWDGNWGYLNGINSRIDRIENPTVMMSSYFDDTAWSLYEATRNL